MPTRTLTPPALGETVYYRLRTPSLEDLVPATVIDRWTDDWGMEQRLLRPRAGTVHLEIQLDPDAHFASGERGLRQHVAEGDAAGCYLRERPQDEDAKAVKRRERQQMAVEINRERMKQQN